MKINQIRPLEEDFTEVLGAIALVPKMLYFYGKMPENLEKNAEKTKKPLVKTEGFLQGRPKCVAIVGARKMTAYGEEIAYKTAKRLAEAGVIVISGLARGIDATAHRGALDGGGVTVAVLGTPIDEISPVSNQSLARRIVENDGVVMSEIAAGEKYYPKTSFLARNRLIAGLAEVILVVEAGEKSGALNTAMHGVEQGKEVMAVPGDIGRPSSVGCNRLILQGARPFLGVEDVLEIVAPEQKIKKRLIRTDNPTEERILSLIAEGVNDGEELIAKLMMAVEEFNVAIALMEIKGFVRSLGMNRWGMG